MPSRQKGRSVKDRIAGTIAGLAVRIREENSLFVAFLQTLHTRDAGEHVMAAGLLLEAVSHLQKMGRLLLLAQQLFASEEEWRQWLRQHCLLDHTLASHYMGLVQKY